MQNTYIPLILPHIINNSASSRWGNDLPLSVIFTSLGISFVVGAIILYIINKYFP